MSYPSPHVRAADIERMTTLAHDLIDQLDPHGPVLLRKLARTEACTTDRDQAPRAGLDSFVTYRIMDADRAERRLLIHPEDRMWPPAEVPISSPLGIALLGTAAGDRIQVEGSGMADPPSVEVLKVEPVSASGFVRYRSREKVLSLADRQ